MLLREETVSRTPALSCLDDRPLIKGYFLALRWSWAVMSWGLCAENLSSPALMLSADLLPNHCIALVPARTA
jgi:hypothetical protein